MAQATSQILGCSQQTVENEWGAEAVNQWSNPSGYNAATTTTNQVSLQQAMNLADALIIQRFYTAGNYSFPLQAGQYATGLVIQWWSIICGFELATARGLSGGVETAGMKAKYDRTIAQIQFYAAGTGANRLQAGMRWPVADTPTTY